MVFKIQETAWRKVSKQDLKLGDFTRMESFYESPIKSYGIKYGIIVSDPTTPDNLVKGKIFIDLERSGTIPSLQHVSKDMLSVVHSTECIFDLSEVEMITGSQNHDYGDLWIEGGDIQYVWRNIEYGVHSGQYIDGCKRISLYTGEIFEGQSSITGSLIKSKDASQIVVRHKDFV